MADGSHRRNHGLILVRHGQSEYNAQGRVTGWANPPLTPLGEKQAAVLGRELRRLDVQPCIVVSSDLCRAVATARLIAAELGQPELEIRSSSGFRERDFGPLTGRLKGCETRESGLQARTHVPAMESATGFAGRVREAFLYGVRPHLEEGRMLLVVSHSHVMRELARMWAPKDVLPAARPANGQAWFFGAAEVLAAVNSASDNP